MAISSRSAYRELRRLYVQLRTFGRCIFAPERAADVTVFIVEQDVRSSLEVADIAYVLENGRIVQTGPAARLLDDPSIKEAYLGL